MRRILLTSLLCAAAALPSAVSAQEKASRSVDEYLCTFAGKCGDEAEAVTKDAPETKGFSLARPGEPRVSSTRGFSLARPANKTATATPAKPAGRAGPAKQTATAQPAAKPARQSYASTSKAGVTKNTKPPRDVAERRADLRLTFELGSATLTSQAREEAKVFAQSLVHPELASKKFVIEGHTDSQGGRAYNLDLSRRRAQAVADYLTSLGVSADRLQVRGYGFDRPLNGRSAASQDNRRVEAVLAS